MKRVRISSIIYPLVEEFLAYLIESRALPVFALILLAKATLSVSAQADPSCTHVYLDESGKSVCAAGWNEIPERFRSTARPVKGDDLESDENGILLWSDAEGGEEAPLSTIYRYKNPAGRECFTNIWDRVPSESRQKAEVIDLSRVTLNTAVGREIDSRLERQHRALIESDYCRQALQQEGKRWWAGAWSEFKPLIVTAAVILLLLLATPFALSRIGAPQWARTLTVAIQVLTLLGLFTFVVLKMNDAYQSVHALSAPCRLDSWDKAAGEPDAPSKHAELIKELRRKIRLFEQQGLKPLEVEGNDP
jgi:hypothetical protein